MSFECNLCTNYWEAIRGGGVVVGGCEVVVEYFNGGHLIDKKNFSWRLGL